MVNSIVNGDNKNLFNPRNVYVSNEGGGAANQWVEGYLHGKSHVRDVVDMIDRELDSCDNLEAFQLVHSVGGGTGSGFGSYLLEELSDRYNKKMIQTYSVFGASEVVVEPYNTMLTLKRLIQNTDANVVFDNHSLMQIATENLKVKSPSYGDINKLISTVMSASTNTLRFPSYSYNSLTSIMSTLIPTPDLHFLTASYTPFTSEYVSHAALDVRRSTAYDVILDLVDPRLQMAAHSESRADSKILSMIDIVVNPKMDHISHTNESIQRALLKARSRLNFAPWTPSMIHLAMGQRSPYVDSTADVVSGLQLANTTSVLSLLRKVTTQYDQLMHRSAFLNNYQKSDFDLECGDIMAEFHESRELVGSLIREYEASESLSYIEDEDDVFEDPCGAPGAPGTGDVDMIG